MSGKGQTDKESKSKPESRNELGVIENLTEIITRATDGPSAEILEKLLAAKEFEVGLSLFDGNEAGFAHKDVCVCW